MSTFVFWANKTNISIGPCPSGYRALPESCLSLRQAGVSVVVSLQTEQEAYSVGLEDEEKAVRDAGLLFYRFPIKDHQPPPFTAETFEFIEKLAVLANAGQRLFIHCFAGIGRSATIAAAVLIEQGYSAKNAIQALSSARGFPVPETRAQREWIEKFALQK